MRSAAAFALALLLSSAACQPSGPVAPHPGTALKTVPRNRASMSAPIPPGEEFIMLRAWVENESDEPIRIEDVTIEGVNLGSVMDVVSVELAPLPGSATSSDYVSGGLYKTDPPVWKYGDHAVCNRQVLTAVDGYILRPGSYARIAVRLRAASVGRFGVLEHVVRYRVNEESYAQSIPSELVGQVRSKATPMRIPEPERQCIDADVAVLGL